MLVLAFSSKFLGIAAARDFGVFLLETGLSLLSHMELSPEVSAEIIQLTLGARLKWKIHSYFLWQTYVVESSTVFEHQQDVINKLLSCEIVESVALVQFPADH